MTGSIPSDALFPIGNDSSCEQSTKAAHLAATCLIPFFCSAHDFLNIGRWLVVEDPLEKASAIAVLSGRMPVRALEAARIYRAGYAPEVWLTHSTEPGATLAKLSVPYSGEDVYDKLILIQQGVPEKAIRILDPPIVNTEDEVLTIGHALQQQKEQKIIIVTSKVHTRRAKALWNRLSANKAAPSFGVFLTIGSMQFTGGAIPVMSST